MSRRVVPATPVVHDVTVEIEIDVEGRWNALALSELLVPFHSFLVQRTAERWVVYARAPGWRGEPIADALRAIEEWEIERRQDAPVRVGRLHKNSATSPINAPRSVERP